MAIALIGSAALKRNGVHLREAGDIDLVGTYKETSAWIRGSYPGQVRELLPTNEGKKLVARITDGTIIDVDLVWPGNSAEALLKLIVDEVEPQDGLYVAPVDVCMMLKQTHRFRKNSPHFLKTRRDLLALRDMGVEFPERHREFYTRRLRETLDYAHPVLNRNKESFFSDDGVGYVYDHDTIHLAVMLHDKPAYEFFKADAAEVFCSKDLFNALPQDIKVAAVYEESCVLAVERCMVPFENQDPERAFLMALEKVCTSITSGWFREFSWEHYDQAVALYHSQVLAGRSYYDLFKKGLEAGIVKPVG
jgi:hypothetical protein